MSFEDELAPTEQRARRLVEQAQSQLAGTGARAIASVDETSGRIVITTLAEPENDHELALK